MDNQNNGNRNMFGFNNNDNLGPMGKPKENLDTNSVFNFEPNGGNTNTNPNPNPNMNNMPNNTSNNLNSGNVFNYEPVNNTPNMGGFNVPNNQSPNMNANSNTSMFSQSTNNQPMFSPSPESSMPSNNQTSMFNGNLMSQPANSPQMPNQGESLMQNGSSLSNGQGMTPNVSQTNEVNSNTNNQNPGMNTNSNSSMFNQSTNNQPMFSPSPENITPSNNQTSMFSGNLMSQPTNSPQMPSQGESLMQNESSLSNGQVMTPNVSQTNEVNSNTNNQNPSMNTNSNTSMFSNNMPNSSNDSKQETNTNENQTNPINETPLFTNQTMQTNQPKETTIPNTSESESKQDTAKASDPIVSFANLANSNDGGVIGPASIPAMPTPVPKPQNEVTPRGKELTPNDVFKTNSSSNTNTGPNLDSDKVFKVNPSLRVMKQNAEGTQHVDLSQGNSLLSSVQPTQNTNTNQNIENIDTTISSDNMDLVKTFMGKNADKILTEKVNIFACLLGPFYLVYRKMIGYMFLIGLLSGVIEGIVQTITKIPLIGYVAVMIFMLFRTDKMYLKHTKKKIDKIIKKNPKLTYEQIKHLCDKNGGTSKLFVILLIAFNVGIIVLIIVLSVFFIGNIKSNIVLTAACTNGKGYTNTLSDGSKVTCTNSDSWTCNYTDKNGTSLGNKVCTGDGSGVMHTYTLDNVCNEGPGVTGTTSIGSETEEIACSEASESNGLYSWSCNIKYNGQDAGTKVCSSDYIN